MKNLETLIIFRATEINKETIDVILESCPNLQRFGDFHSTQTRILKMLLKLICTYLVSTLGYKLHYAYFVIYRQIVFKFFLAENVEKNCTILGNEKRPRGHERSYTPVRKKPSKNDT